MIETEHIIFAKRARITVQDCFKSTTGNSKVTIHGGRKRPPLKGGLFVTLCQNEFHHL